MTHLELDNLSVSFSWMKAYEGLEIELENLTDYTLSLEDELIDAWIKISKLDKQLSRITGKLLDLEETL